MNLSVNFNIDEYSNQKFVSNNQCLLTKYIHAIISFESVELCEKNWELFLESLTEKKKCSAIEIFLPSIKNTHCRHQRFDPLLEVA